MSFLDGLLPASFRGIPFFVNAVATKVGRRVAVHEYPYRDTIWVEDLGRGVRAFGFRGFVAGPLATIQHAALLLAMEKEGPGTLTHPSLGIFTCSLVSFASTQSDDAMGVFAVEMEFLETGEVQFPSGAADASSGISLGSLNLLNSSASLFVRVIGTGAAILGQLHTTISAWANLPLALAADASAVAGCVTGLGDAFGRYQGGKGSVRAVSGSTATTLLAANRTAQAAVSAAVVAASAAIDMQDQSALASSVQAIAVAARNAATNPADQVRILSAMAAFSPVTPTDSSDVGQSIAATEATASRLCRHSALSALALACKAYAPTSFDDAVTLRANAIALFDTEISATTDIATGTDLRALRAAIGDSLAARGADLAPLQTVELGSSLPAFVLAQRLYQDGTRADELTARVNPVHPAFFPTRFRALAF